MSRDIDAWDGRHLHLDGEVYVVQGKIAGRPTYRLTARDGRTPEIPLHEFNQYCFEERVTPPDRAPGSHAAIDISPRQQREVEFRRFVLDQVREIESDGVPISRGRDALGQRLRCHPVFQNRKTPSLSSIRRWKKADKSTDPTALVPRTKNCGNRTRRYDDTFEQICLDVLERTYLTTDRRTILETWREAKRLYLDTMKQYGRKPGNCGLKAFYRVLSILPAYEIFKRRCGAKVARKMFLAAKSFMDVHLPYDRIELDCTTADVFCVDECGEVVGRVTICIAVDCATGLILGLQIDLKAPNSALVARTIREILEPKADAWFAEHGIQNRFHPIGTPRKIVTDHGSENAGERNLQIVSQLGIDWSKCIPGHPEQKPQVERTFREVNRCLRTLPGATATNDLPEKARIEKAQAEACLTFDEIYTRLQQWRYDIYAVMPKRHVESLFGISESPLRCWQRLEAESLLPEPPSQEALFAAFHSFVEKRKLQHYGVEFCRLQYHCDELEEVWRHYGPKHAFEIRYDPDDIRLILLKDPRTGRYVRVPCKHTNMPAMSFDELKELRRRHPKTFDEEDQARAVLRSLQDDAEKANPYVSKGRAAKSLEIARRQKRKASEKESGPAKLAQGTVASPAETEPASTKLRRPARAAAARPRMTVGSKP